MKYDLRFEPHPCPNCGAEMVYDTAEECGAEGETIVFSHEDTRKCRRVERVSYSDQMTVLAHREWLDSQKAAD